METGTTKVATSLNDKPCAKCGIVLLQNGIHMGIPFAYTWNDPKVLVCSKCYDLETVDEDKVELRK